MADRDGDGDAGAAVPVTPSTVKVHAQFVQVGERRVFVRHAGCGPALVVLHQSPQSSASMQPWFERFAATHAVFAPDTPGFGRSDPLPRAQPTIPDFAQALGELLQALGLQRVPLYGVHSGAAIAARLALDQPQRVAALVCDGLSGSPSTNASPCWTATCRRSNPALMAVICCGCGRGCASSTCSSLGTMAAQQRASCTPPCQRPRCMPM